MQQGEEKEGDGGGRCGGVNGIGWRRRRRKRGLKGGVEAASREDGVHLRAGRKQGCQVAKFDPFLSLDCTGLEGGGGRAIQRIVA